MNRSRWRNMGACYLSGLLLVLFSHGIAVSTDMDFDFTQPFSADAFFMRVSYIDSDAYPDLVFSSSDGNSINPTTGVFIAYGNSSHSFDSPVRLLTDDVATITLDYVSADTLIDIVIIPAFRDNGFVLVNTGSRTFDTAAFTLYEQSVYASLATGYFNNDAYLDLVYGDNATTQAEIHFGDGTGSFPTDTILPFGLGGVAVGDFNEDGFDDIVCKPFGELVDTVAILLNDSLGHFTIASTAWSPGMSPGITTANGSADFNNDGHTDFAVASFIAPPTSFLSVGLGDGSGGIAQLDTFRLTGYHLIAEAVDVDNDNNMDIVSAGASAYGPGPHLAIFRGDGTGGFTDTLIAHPTDIASLALTAIDIDQDGDMDFVSGTSYYGPAHPITIMYNQLSARSADKSSSSSSAALTISATTESAVGANSSVGIDITNPQGRRFTRDVRSISGANYWRLDVDANGSLDERIVDYTPVGGKYSVAIHPHSAALSGTPFTLRINAPGRPEAVLALNYDGFSGGSPDDNILLHYTNSSSSPVQPRNGVASGTAQPTFSWPSAFGATVYQIQIDPYHDFRAPIYDANNLTQPSFVPSSSLNNETVYYWRYRSFDGAQWSEYSSTYAAFISACCIGIRGNANGSVDENPSIADLVYLVAHLFNNGPAPNCSAEADVSGSGSITIADLTRLVSYLFASGPAPAACPAN